MGSLSYDAPPSLIGDSGNGKAADSSDVNKENRSSSALCRLRPTSLVQSRVPARSEFKFVMRSRYNKSEPNMAGGFKRKSNYKVSADDDDEDAPTSKKGRTGGSDFQPSTAAKTDSDGNKYWEISKARRITVSEFKKMPMVNIREYYQADGKWLPGKKVRLIFDVVRQRS